jgi:hypothetical protein
MKIKFICKLTDFFNREKEILKLKEEIKFLKKSYKLNELAYTSTIEEYQEKVSKMSANVVLENMLKREINWFDYEERDADYQKEYFNNAKQILENPVFLNEFNAFVVDMTKAVLTETDDDRLLKGDEDKLLLIKYSLNGLKAFEERIKSIKIPDKFENFKIEDLTEAI